MDKSASHVLDDLLIPTGEAGVYLRSEKFEEACSRLQRGFDKLYCEEGIERVHSSGMVSLDVIERSSYREKLPQFVSTVTSDPRAGDQQAMAVLPSACLCIYPHLQGRRPFRASGMVTAVTASCVRNEAGYAPDRMRAFTMSEYVFVGGPDAALKFRSAMLEKVSNWTAHLKLDARVEQASDPFFGRLGEILAAEQRRQDLKLEVLVPVAKAKEIACFSLNNHHDFFAGRWDLRLDSGDLAHSCCLGVGIERLALAMFHRHGRDVAAWPGLA